MEQHATSVVAGRAGAACRKAIALAALATLAACGLKGPLVAAAPAASASPVAAAASPR